MVVTLNNQEFLQWCQNKRRKPLVMGILNVTPDSFSDGALFLQPEKALAQVQAMLEAQADVIDIGGESTRPYAKPVTATEELERTIPIIQKIRAFSDICISIDTSKGVVMQEAVASGAGLINDVRALADGQALRAAAALQVPVCLVHMQGSPETMQLDPEYEEPLIPHINAFFSAQIERCLQAGLKREQLILDPGFGFGKTVAHNMQLVKHLAKFQAHQLPVMLGVSRKSSIGVLLDKPVQERLIGSTALNVIAAMNGAHIIRTHDVKETKEAMRIFEAVQLIGTTDESL